MDLVDVGLGLGLARGTTAGGTTAGGTTAGGTTAGGTTAGGSFFWNGAQLFQCSFDTKGVVDLWRRLLHPVPDELLILIAKKVDFHIELLTSHANLNYIRTYPSM